MEVPAPDIDSVPADFFDTPAPHTFIQSSTEESTTQQNPNPIRKSMRIHRRPSKCDTERERRHFLTDAITDLREALESRDLTQCPWYHGGNPHPSHTTIIYEAVRVVHEMTTAQEMKPLMAPQCRVLLPVCWEWHGDAVTGGWVWRDEMTLQPSAKRRRIDAGQAIRHDGALATIPEVSTHGTGDEGQYFV